MNKFTKLIKTLSKYYQKPVHFNLSPASGYRSRCEYGYKNNYYTMINNDKKIFLKTHILPSSSIQSSRRLRVPVDQGHQYIHRIKN